MRLEEGLIVKGFYSVTKKPRTRQPGLYNNQTIKKLRKITAYFWLLDNVVIVSSFFEELKLLPK